jgi:hypothetical protein
VLAKIAKAESRIAAGLPKLTKAEQTARANGNTVRADRLAKRIARFESPAMAARLAKITKRIDAACNL